MNLENIKDRVAIRKGYPSWQEMENWIIDHNQPAGIAQLLVGAMEEVSSYRVLKPVMISMCDKTMSKRITRVWEMPNSRTFEIKAIKKLIQKYQIPECFSIDPFANKSRLARFTNDLDPECKADYCLEAVEFLRQFDNDVADLVLFDPPYTPRQLSECYKSLGRSVNFETTQSSFWRKVKSQIARTVKHGGFVITCGWNSNGIGKKYGFQIVEILLVAHGAGHNDTIVTVEKKVQSSLCLAD
jgi:hypothetical protein